MSDNTAKQLENNEETKEVEINNETIDLEVEVVDDTPEEDKNKARKEGTPKTAIPEDDEIKQYSNDVQKRLKTLKYEYHEERRAKEAAERTKEEAVQALEKVVADNKKLRKTLDDGEGVLVDQAKKRVSAELEQAKKEYKDAYEAGDPDKLVEAQSKLSRAQSEQIQVERYKPPAREAVESNTPVPKQPAPVKKQEPTKADKEWLSKNEDWFQKDGFEDMTGFVFGVHEKLVKAKINPILEPEEYYKRIDESIQNAFPKYFNKQDVETKEVVAPQRSAGNVVAPVERSAKKPRKVQLTSTQINLAKRLGLSPEQYAQQLLKESN